MTVRMTVCLDYLNVTSLRLSQSLLFLNSLQDNELNQVVEVEVVAGNSDKLHDCEIRALKNVLRPLPLPRWILHTVCKTEQIKIPYTV